MDPFVRTVLGDLDPARLGRVDYHEHLFQVSPLLAGDELDDEAASTREAALLAGSGFDAMIDATPLGLGRDAAAIARISRTTGLRVVMSTGAHRSAHYAPGHPLLDATAADLEARFARDLLDGADDTPVRAGLIKTGIDYWRIDAFARRVLEAAAGAHVQTGAPIMVHLEHGSAGFEVLDLLEGLGVPAGRVVLAHVDRSPDPGLHTELAARGAYLGYDGAARHREWPDSVLIACLADVVAAGGGDRVLLGGDVARRSRYAAYGGMPGLAYLGERFAPRVRTAIGDAALDRILIANPARLLTWAR
jgi:phosphotriesterase-related protein